MSEQNSSLLLPDDVEMPAIALGTWPMNDAETAEAVDSALRLGYRHIDTAENYDNEIGVGEGIRRSGLARDDLFITTKFNRQWHSEAGVQEAFAGAAERLGVDYIDLFLIHWPNPDQNTYVEAFQALQSLKDQGKVRAVGVSNFKPAHLQDLLDAGLVPAVNQIQLDPERASTPAISVNRSNGIATFAYSPLGRGGEFLKDAAIVETAEAHEKTPSQVALRWLVQNGYGAAPKSANPKRQAENLDIFDFELTVNQMHRIASLDVGASPRLDADEFGH